jgi:hypothetical protein
MAGPEAAKDAANTHASAPTTPPGTFLSSELESDTARFLAEVKDMIHRRNQAEQRRPFG